MLSSFPGLAHDESRRSDASKLHARCFTFRSCVVCSRAPEPEPCMIDT